MDCKESVCLKSIEGCKFSLVPISRFEITGCSFATLPNAFRQCTISLLIIHSAIDKGWAEKLPNPSYIVVLWNKKG